MNWECLLAACPAGIDIYIVTQDQDFVSKMDKEQISGFLSGEWHREKGGSAFLYRRISDLFRDKFPDIALAAEFEKELRIRRLIESGSFDRTHTAIARLVGYTEFSQQQAEDMLEAALENNQIGWIAHDSDVLAFVRGLIEVHRGELDSELVESLEELFGEDGAE